MEGSVLARWKSKAESASEPGLSANQIQSAYQLYKPLAEQTCDVDVVDDAEDVVMVDLAFPLVLEDVVHGHGAPDLSSLSHHLPVRAQCTQ